MSIRRPLALALAALFVSLPAAASHHEGGAMGKGKHKAEHAKEHAEHAKEKAADAKAGAEDAQGEAMRERRDERKQIMEEARSGAEPGTPRKGKKPWWKFWGSDDAE